MAITYNIEKLVQITHGQVHGRVNPDVVFHFLLTDSRRVVFPVSTVFFALASAKNNGHKYIPELIEKGVVCFVVNTLPRDKKWLDLACFIQVKDTLEALQELAVYHRSLFSLPILGITGSNGKTIVKEWISQLMAERLSVVKSPRSYNSQIGVPLSIWQIEDNHELGIFEAGISQAGEMIRLQRIISPDAGIFTNIGPAHAEGFTDITHKIHEKLNLFSESKVLIYHSDDSLLDRCIRQWAIDKPMLKLFTWGRSQHADIKLKEVSRKVSEYHLELEIDDHIYLYTIPFTDEASLENALHCIAFMVLQGYSHQWIAERILRLQPIAMRMEHKQAINNCSLINDSYNSDVYSLGIALDFLASQVQHKSKLLIMSDILQSGMPAEKLYTEVASLLKEKRVNRLIAIGDAIQQHQHCFRGIKALFYTDTDAFLSGYDFNELQNQAILLKGAREFGFERISNKLQLKDHQTLLEINLDALVHNLNVYRSLLDPGQRIMAMVKAFSYGSGSFEIASVFQFHRIDYLAVAFADEGYDLREAGITMPIVVLNPELHNLDILFRYQLEPEIYSLDLYKRFAREAKRFSSLTAHNPFPIHIKLDTRMHRLGFMPHELDELIQLLNATPALKVASVFSHLAASDLSQFDDFTLEQIELFKTMSEKIEQGIGYGFLRHIANSTAVSRFPEARFDMVRLGIGLYGVDGNSQIEKLLHNVTTFRTVISQIKTIPVGETIGYNRAGKVERETRLAIIPAGYADGLDRRLGNGNGYLLVNGQKAPIIGNISMDMCTVDITGLQANVGDDIVIFGRDLSVKELAKKLDTIPYEILTKVSARVKRIYFQE